MIINTISDINRSNTNYIFSFIDILNYLYLFENLETLEYSFDMTNAGKENIYIQLLIKNCKKLKTFKYKNSQGELIVKKLETVNLNTYKPIQIKLQELTI